MKSRDVIDTVVGAIDRAVGRVDGVRLEHKGIVEDIEARICRPAWCVLFADDVTDEDAFEAMRTNLCVAVLAAIKESVSAPRAAASRSGGALETSR